jgi:hypothetical protein
MRKLWNKKPIALLQAEAEDVATQQLLAHGGVPLRRTLSATSLVALGIGKSVLGYSYSLARPQRPMPVRPSACLSW